MGVRVRTDGNQVKIQVFPWQIPDLINIKKEIELVLKKLVLNISLLTKMVIDPLV